MLENLKEKPKKEKNCDNCNKEYCDDVYYGFNEHCDYFVRIPFKMELTTLKHKVFIR